MKTDMRVHVGFSSTVDLDRISDTSLVADWDSNAESKSISDSVSQFSLAQSEGVNSHATSGKVAWLDAGSDD